jgi:hypothetical protein
MIFETDVLLLGKNTLLDEEKFRTYEKKFPPVCK